MDQIVPEPRSCFDDLTWFSIDVVVDDVVTELYGVVDSESDNNVNRDAELIEYLTQTNNKVSLQSMARTKQKARKMDKDGKLTATTTGNTGGTPTPALQSPGGQNIATFPRRTGRLLESDLELEQAVAMFSVGSPPVRSTRSQMPIRGTSPARGSPRRGTPGRGRSPARSSPARGSPKRGTPGHGRSPARGTPGRSPGRGTPVNPKPKPVGMVNLQVKPSTSGITPGRPGQAGYVNRGRGGGSGRGASRSSPARYDLPSFSTEDDDDDDNDDNDNGDDDAEEDMEVDFPNLGQPLARVPQRRPIAVKNMNLIRAPKKSKSGFAEIARWNRTARQGVYNETKRGWMAK